MTPQLSTSVGKLTHRELNSSDTSLGDNSLISAVARSVVADGCEMMVEGQHVRRIGGTQVEEEKRRIKAILALIFNSSSKYLLVTSLKIGREVLTSRCLLSFCHGKCSAR